MIMNILDWDKLKAFVEERKPVEVSAGIIDDWSSTGDTVYKDGVYIENNGAFTHSSWAHPGFKAELENGDVVEVVAFRKATDEEVQRIRDEGKAMLGRASELIRELRKRERGE